jgi:hypothetical protein
MIWEVEFLDENNCPDMGTFTADFAYEDRGFLKLDGFNGVVISHVAIFAPGRWRWCRLRREP